MQIWAMVGLDHHLSWHASAPCRVGKWRIWASGFPTFSNFQVAAQREPNSDPPKLYGALLASAYRNFSKIAMMSGIEISPASHALGPPIRATRPLPTGDIDGRDPRIENLHQQPGMVVITDLFGCAKSHLRATPVLPCIH